MSSSESSPSGSKSSIKSFKDLSRKQLDTLKKRTSKFHSKILKKISQMGDISDSQKVEIANKYKKKYNISDAEFNLFIKHAIHDQTLAAHYNVPNTEMAKVLGFSHINTAGDKLSVKPDEISVVNDIIRVHAETKVLHSQIVLQTLTYADCELSALIGASKFPSTPPNTFSYVHPVIAALFLPKVKLLEEHMLLSNIGYIIKCKQQGTQILTKPDFELYWDMITDPATHVCNTTPIKDLYHRYILQTKLWDNVLMLRQGRIYSEKLGDFMAAIENCSNGIFDAPDLTYVKDEGTILRRLLGAFSIRPTVVSTSRLFNNFVSASANYGMVDPFTAQGITQITTIPMVTLRLPYRNVTGNPILLDDALTQPQWFVEHKMIVPKTQTILHSRDVIFFYVGRRFQHINLSRMNSPYNFTKLPMTIAGVEQINDTPVDVQPVMDIMNESYQLRSVVTVDRSARNDKLIVGNSACIVSYVHGAVFDHNYYLYSPLSANQVFPDPATGMNTRNPAITQISYSGGLDEDDISSFQYRSRHCGTIYMYQKIGGNSDIRLPVV